MGTYHISEKELTDMIIEFIEGVEGEFTIKEFSQATRNAWNYLFKKNKITK